MIGMDSEGSIPIFVSGNSGEESVFGDRHEVSQNSVGAGLVPAQDSGVHSISFVQKY